MFLNVIFFCEYLNQKRLGNQKIILDLKNNYYVIILHMFLYVSQCQAINVCVKT